MLTVKTAEEGLGDHDGHIVAATLNVNSRSLKDSQEIQ